MARFPPWLLTRIRIVRLARSLMTAAAAAVSCKLTPVCLAVVLGGGSAVRVSERRSRSSHHHRGRHKSRHNQQTNALNHAISFPYHTHLTVYLSSRVG